MISKTRDGASAQLITCIAVIALCIAGLVLTDSSGRAGILLPLVLAVVFAFQAMGRLRGPAPGR